jgi:hypothetical protein
MKARLARVLVKKKNFIPLLFSFFAIISISSETIAQGWTFTFQVDQSGPCTGVPPLPVPNLPNFGIPTKNECESLRQTLLAIRSSYPVTDSKGNYIGECTMYVSCTPCTGSDIVVASQASSGEVSFNGQYTGEPLYSSHESSAFEDWSLDYRQQLASYGITSILGNTLTPPGIPLTGDRDFDAFYTSQSASFNPTTPAHISKGIDASVVDLTGKTGMVGLLTTAEEQAKRDNWYEEKGFNTLSPITAAAGIEESKPAEKDFKESSLRFALEQLPIVGTVAGGMLNVVDVVLGEDGLPKAVEQATKMDYQGAANTADNMQAGVKTAVANTMLETIINSFVDPIKGAMNSGIIAAFKVGEKGEKAVGIVTGGAELYQSWKKKN